MDDIKITECLQCGGKLEINHKTGIPTCKFCGREYKDAVEGYSYELQEIVNRRQMREFIQAEELCKELLRKQPESSEAYWQTLLSTLGVVYVREEGRAKPTFFSYSYDDRELIQDNEYYKKAILYARSNADKEFYRVKAEELDVLLKEFFELVAKENSYDIFISFKRTTEAIVDGEKRTIDTDDYMKAREIYDSLKDKYKVFFSPVSIGSDTGIEGEKYEPRILKALQTAQAMILIGSRKEYLEAQWVENEWRRYQYFIQKGNKQKQSLILGYFRNMPSLPTALKDIQLPSFDMFKGNYLEEVRKKVSFVKSSKGLKSVIGERKIKSDFKDEEGQFNFGYNVTRVEITGKGGEASIHVSATEERDMQTAEHALHSGDFQNAIALYSILLKKNPNNSKAYIGRFCAKIKVNELSKISVKAYTAKDDDFNDYEQAIQCSVDKETSWKLVDYLINGLTVNVEWHHLKKVFNFVIRYVDNDRIIRILDLLTKLINHYLNEGKVKVSEDIFKCARSLFVEENLDYNIECMNDYATMLLKTKHFALARKYFEELAWVRKDSEYYLHLLESRLKTTDITKKAFTLHVDDSDDASIKKPSELDIDEIIERILVCDAEKENKYVSQKLLQSVLYQMVHNEKNVRPFIEIFVGFYVQLDLKKALENFLLEIANRYIQLKKFKKAKVYYTEVLSRDINNSKAHWGLLKCRLKAFDDVDLSRRGKKLMRFEEFENAISCANNEDYAYYMAVYNGNSGVVNQKRINWKTYLSLTKAKRYSRNTVMALLLCAVIAGTAFSVNELRHSIKIRTDGDTDIVFDTGFFFGLTEKNLSIGNAENNSNVKIDDFVFENKTNIESVVLLENVNEIGKGAFAGCENLNAVTIKANSISIGDRAFSGCKNLSQVVIEDIKINFDDVDGVEDLLQLLVYAKNIKVSIGEGAFSGCEAITALNLRNVSYIGNRAFDGCVSLKEIHIDAGDNADISDTAFDGLSSNTVIYFPSTSVKLIKKMRAQHPNLTIESEMLDPVQDCIFFIDQIGTVTLENEDAIKLAEEKYNALSDDDKQEITNLRKLQEARSAYSILKAIEAIDNIGDITLSSGEEIAKAEGMYSALSDTEKKKVTNSSTLLSYRKSYDLAVRIDSVGEITTDSVGMIAELLGAYENLSDAEKQDVCNSDILFNASNRLGVLLVIELINDIGAVTLDSETQIKLAENAYAELSDEQKNDVPNIGDLTSKRKVFDCIVQINGIGTVTLESGSTIEAAEVTYVVLTPAEQSQVSNALEMTSKRKVFDCMVQINGIGTVTLESGSTIEAAEATYVGLTSAEQSQVSNASEITSKRKVLDCMVQINGIGTVTLESGSTIESAEATYVGLTSAEQSQVSNASEMTSKRKVLDCMVQINGIGTVTLESGSTIEAAEAIYVGLTSAEQYQVSNASEMTFKRKVFDCMVQINGIGTVTLESESEISQAEAFYNLLSEQQKMLISNYALLVEARSVYIYLSQFKFVLKYDGTYSVSAGNITDSTIILPENYNDRAVTSIDNEAFRECSSLTSITIPSSITNIGSDAFKDCTSITSITIPESVTSIGSDAFYNCSSLKSITIPDSVTSIGDSAFYGCHKLVEIYNLSSSLTITKGSYSNGHVAYYALDVYTSADEASKISTTDDGYVFYENGDMVYLLGYSGSDTPLSLPEKYNGKNYGIYKFAFYNCSSLKSITIPDGVTSIGSSAFSGCSSLENITLPFIGATKDGTSDTHFGYIFGADVYSDNRSCIPTSLKTVVITGGASIGSDAFYNCSSLKSITIPDSVTSIGDSAFYGCNKLVEVYNLSGLNITAGSSDNGYVGYYALDVYTSLSETSKLHQTGDGYIFYEDGEVVYLMGYTGTDTELTLPNKYNEKNYSINKYAFCNCESLTSITIPKGVTSIGSSAFRGCTSLTSMTIPDSVTSIGARAFYNCESLTSITIPEGVTSIGENAFYNCSSLKSITIPDSVTSIGSYAFYNCARLASVKIGNGVTSIGYRAFEDCTSLTSITIPESVTSIGGSAFEDCTSLASITIPEGVTSIGYRAFSGCTSLEYNRHNNGRYLGNGDNLYVVLVDIVNTSITSFEIPDTVKTICDYAFCNCSSLKSITIPEGVTSIGENAFYDCDSLTSVTIGDGVTSIGENAFYNCTSLESITIPESVTSIGGGAFKDCTGLTSITIPEGVTSIGYDAFSGCINLTSITIPEGVTSIGSYAFSGCINLTSITIPDSVTSIYRGAFYGCTSLESITLPFVGETKDGTENTHFGYIFGASSYSDNSSCVPTSLKTVVITGGSSIGYRAFYECTSLTSITIPDSVTSIGDSAFEDCTSLEAVYITDIAAWCNIDFEGHSSNPLSNACNLYINGDLVTELVIPDSVTSIGIYAFYNCKSLTSVTIGEGVTSVGNHAFYGCKSLTSITIPEGVTSIGNHAFYGCKSLTSVTIGDGVTSIGENAFYGCYKLVEVYNLSELNITAGSSDNEYVGYYALNVYTSLGETSRLHQTDDRYIFYEDGEAVYLMGYVGTDAELILPDKYNGKNYEIYKYAFYDCRSLTIATIGEGVTSIGENAFYNCTSLESITIPEGVTSIGDYAFSWCSSLTSITIPEGVTSIGNSAFSGCYKLVEVYNLSGLNITAGSSDNGYVGTYALDVYTSLSETSKLHQTDDGYIFYEDGEAVYLMGYVGTDAELILPDKYNGKNYEIYKYAFYNCASLTSITFEGTMEQWKAIEKGYNWNYETGEYVVYCTDGKLDKNGNEIVE